MAHKNRRKLHSNYCNVHRKNNNRSYRTVQYRLLENNHPAKSINVTSDNIDNDAKTDGITTVNYKSTTTTTTQVRRMVL